MSDVATSSSSREARFAGHVRPLLRAHEADAPSGDVRIQLAVRGCNRATTRSSTRGRRGVAGLF